MTRLARPAREHREAIRRLDRLANGLPKGSPAADSVRATRDLLRQRGARMAPETIAMLVTELEREHATEPGA